MRTACLLRVITTLRREEDGRSSCYGRKPHPSERDAVCRRQWLRNAPSGQRDGLVCSRIGDDHVVGMAASRRSGSVKQATGSCGRCDQCMFGVTGMFKPRVGDSRGAGRRVVLAENAHPSDWEANCPATGSRDLLAAGGLAWPVSVRSSLPVAMAVARATSRGATGGQNPWDEKHGSRVPISRVAGEGGSEMGSRLERPGSYPATRARSELPAFFAWLDLCGRSLSENRITLVTPSLSSHRFRLPPV